MIPDQVRNMMRLHHYSIHTERTYIDWIKRYITMSWRDSADSALHPTWGLIASGPAAWDSSPSSCYVEEYIRPQVLYAVAEFSLNVAH